MIRIPLFASACLALAACGMGVSSDNNAASVCNTMLAGDPEIVEDLAEDGDTIEVYCGCYQTLLADKSEDDQADILKVSQVVADIREDESLGLEDAAGRLMSDFIEDGGSPAYGITRSDFEMTGTYIDQVRRELNKDDSACTAS